MQDSTNEKRRGNPHGWTPIKSPHIPVQGYEYRAKSDGSSVIIQRRVWIDPHAEFRTRVRMPLESWKNFEAAMTGKTEDEAAHLLSRIAQRAKQQ